jgi:hypothetical protein
MNDTEMDDVSTDGVIEHCGIEFDDMVTGRKFTRLWV